MSSPVAPTQGLEPIQRPYPFNLLPTTKSKSCPALGQKHVPLKKGSLYFHAAQELMTFSKNVFLCLNDQFISYCGQPLDTNRLVKLVESRGVKVFTSLIYIPPGDNTSSGTCYVQFTSLHPSPARF